MGEPRSLERLGEEFAARFGAVPTHVSRAPGRVNLIGEHTDYNDLAVLPMALQREVRIALRPRPDGVVRLVNVSDEFEPVTFRIGPDIPRSPTGHWGNYVKAPADELARRFAIPRGFDGLVASDLPVASGLSSSSALVNAVGLALAGVNGVDQGPLALADVMAEAERYTGTRGGGMDQAVSMTAQSGHAARIDFAPLRLRHVPVPGSWRIVVADTGLRAEKSGRLQQAYNARRQACEEALTRVSTEAVERGALEEGAAGYPRLLAALGYDGALALGKETLRGVLSARFRHVVTEARRVDQAEEALAADDPVAFGALMNDSHESLRVDYEVSGPELDALVACARAGGALGARLTGAGFGGCIVALGTAETVEGILQAIRRDYRPPRAGAAGAGRAFVAVPSAGASVRRWGG